MALSRNANKNIMIRILRIRKKGAIRYANAVDVALSNPTGYMKFTSRTEKSESFRNEAYSIKARYGPEYSNTMASCTMVNSRCVAGLSTGYRAFSASANNTSARRLNSIKGCSKILSCESMPLICDVVLFMAIAAKIKIMVGSTSEAIAISRAAPMPPNADADSMPPNTRNTAVSMSTPATMTKLLYSEKPPTSVISGSKRMRKSADPNTTNGAKRKTHEVLSEITISFFRSVRSVKYGKNGDAPFRP